MMLRLILVLMLVACAHAGPQLSGGTTVDADLTLKMHGVPSIGRCVVDRGTKRWVCLFEGGPATGGRVEYFLEMTGTVILLGPNRVDFDSQYANAGGEWVHGLAVGEPVSFPVRRGGALAMTDVRGVVTHYYPAATIDRVLAERPLVRRLRNGSRDY